MFKAILAVVAVAIVMAGGPARADKVTEAIERAVKAYGDGKLSTTSRELQFAIGRIGRRIAKAYATTLPPAPDGWRARRARSQRSSVALMNFGVSVQRRYSQDGGRGRASAQLVIDNPMIGAMATMFANPAIAQNAGYERLEVRGLAQPGFIKFNEDTKRGDAIILIAGRLFLKVEASNVEGEDVLRALVDGWNIKRIKEIAEIP
jgi:hypothetical protein